MSQLLFEMMQMFLFKNKEQTLVLTTSVLIGCWALQICCDSCPGLQNNKLAQKCNVAKQLLRASVSYVISLLCLVSTCNYFVNVKWSFWANTLSDAAFRHMQTTCMYVCFCMSAVPVHLAKTVSFWYSQKDFFQPADVLSVSQQNRHNDDASAQLNRQMCKTKEILLCTHQSGLRHPNRAKRMKLNTQNQSFRWNLPSSTTTQINSLTGYTCI